jgi:hypothetical protein
LIVRFSLLLLLSGCAAFSLSEADCHGMNWYQRGYDDGYFGNPPQDLHLAAKCSPVKISDEQYLAGWRAGHDEWDRLIGSYGQD